MILNDITDRQNIQNWTSLVRNTLSNFGFRDVWLEQGVEDVNKFSFCIKAKTI